MAETKAVQFDGYDLRDIIHIDLSFLKEITSNKKTKIASLSYSFLFHKKRDFYDQITSNMKCIISHNLSFIDDS